LNNRAAFCYPLPRVAERLCCSSTGLYVLATIFPPLLPTVFVVSLYISARRLQAKRISCQYPEAVLLAGKVDAVFFDKTGTLTQLGLEFVSFEGGDSGDRIQIGMAVCHTLTTKNNGEIVGNQVDLCSFQTTGATLLHKGADPPRISLNGETYTVLKRFEFDSHRATQSVIVEDAKYKRQIFVKGSAEVIKSLCMESSLPADFDETVQESAIAGIYQIAMAYRSYNLSMELSNVRREDVEGSLTFAGFINFRNPMREETSEVLWQVEESDMTLAMITGDNVFTGIFIARESGMMKQNRNVIVGRLGDGKTIEWYDVGANVIVERPSLRMMGVPGNGIDIAITGEAWNILSSSQPQYAEAIMKHIRVFGRCKPADKVSVVTSFATNGYTTLMCGDGQNDCGCLKAAHVGVALSNAEASIVAPFTSLDKSLPAVLEVIREGRCALASTVSAYSFYMTYGQTETFLQVLNAYFAITLSEWCWVFLDGMFSISLAFSIPFSQAAHQLTSRRPTDRLLGTETLFSVCGVLAWNLFYMVLALVVLFQQDWFQCRKWSASGGNLLEIVDNYEASVIFLVGGYQYIASAIVMNFGYTFRQPWYRNFVFVFLVLTWTILMLVVALHESTLSCLFRVNCENEVSVQTWDSALLLQLFPSETNARCRGSLSLEELGAVGDTIRVDPDQQYFQLDSHACRLSIQDCWHYGG
jgi:predicted P-type ATPase